MNLFIPSPHPIIKFPLFLSHPQSLLFRHHYHRRRRRINDNSITTVTTNSYSSSRRFIPFFFTTATANSYSSAVVVARAVAEEEEEEVDQSTEEEEEEDDVIMAHGRLGGEGGGGFIEVGYISKVHGLKGELRVIPNTGFPHLRFSKPGKRWLRAHVLGKEVISEVELISGRDHPGQKSWIITLRGIHTVDLAKKIVGSTLLVKDGDRPDLGEGEFYTPDLVGMRVVLKETDRLVGVVANVFNHGANDLLQVILNSTEEKVDLFSSSKSDIGASGRVVWVPFVEAIVPEVDMDKKEMYITPPKGLLELNLRKDGRSKKERRQLEWKERKKLQQLLIAAKKKLSEMRQDHLFDCLKVGDKAQKSLLIKQIVNINFELFQHAMQCIDKPSDRFNLSDFIYANSAILQKTAFKISLECLSCYTTKEKNELNYRLHKAGLQLLMESKAAIVILLHSEVNVGKDLENEAICISPLEAKLRYFQELILVYKKQEQSISVPLILVSPAHELQSYKEFLLDNDYFDLDSQKVWFLEEEKLPIVSISSDSPKILMKSSCEIIQASTGSGGVFSLLSSHGMADKLSKIGVEYIQICRLGERYRPAAVGNPLLLGLVNSCGAEMGITIMQDRIEEAKDDEFNMVFSMMHLNKICNQIDDHHFFPAPEQRVHVELVKLGGKYVEQIHAIPDEPNSYRLHSSIFSALNTCPLDSICVMYISE